jgi:hypothetical protein
MYNSVARIAFFKASSLVGDLSTRDSAAYHLYSKHLPLHVGKEDLTRALVSMLKTYDSYKDRYVLSIDHNRHVARGSKGGLEYTNEYHKAAVRTRQRGKEVDKAPRQILVRPQQRSVSNSPTEVPS